MDFMSLDVDTLLKVEQEMPGSIIDRDGMTYINLELLLSIVEQTIEVNLENDQNQGNELLGMVIIMKGLRESMRWATELLQVKHFQQQLEEIQVENL
jgi:hypothetical protein